MAHLKSFERVCLRLVFITLAAALVVMPQRARALDASELISYFIDQLTPYGQWQDRAPYGRVWSPYPQSSDWRPYSQGEWVHSDEYGWVWKPQEDWGEIPYHYGRWGYEQNKWFWVPDDNWAPAWVDWRQNDDFIGWAPLPPQADWSWRDEWRPSYSQPHYAQSSYVYVPQRYFGSSNIRNYYLSEQQARPLYSKTRNITIYRTVNEHIVNDGPRRAVIEGIIGRPIVSQEYEPRSLRGQALPASFRRHEHRQREQSIARVIETDHYSQPRSPALRQPESHDQQAVDRSNNKEARARGKFFEQKNRGIKEQVSARVYEQQPPDQSRRENESQKKQDQDSRRQVQKQRAPEARTDDHPKSNAKDSAKRSHPIKGKQEVAGQGSHSDVVNDGKPAKGSAKNQAQKGKKEAHAGQKGHKQ